MSQLAAPALYKLLEKGEVDAMLNISSFTIQAASEPEKFRSIFSPNEYWKKKTGYPIVWSAPLVAWKSWVNENPDPGQEFRGGDRGIVPLAARSGKLRRRGQEVRHARGRIDPAAVAIYKKWLAREEDIPGGMGPEGRRCPVAVPGTGEEVRHPGHGARQKTHGTRWMIGST